MHRAPCKNRFSPLCIVISQNKANLQNWIDFSKIQVHIKKFFKYTKKSSSTNAKIQVFLRFQVLSLGGNPVNIYFCRENLNLFENTKTNGKNLLIYLQN